MPKIVSLINWKGGVGKTTLTLHLAAGLAGRHGKNVLLIDLDAQCNLSFLAVGASSYIDHTYTKNNPTLKNVFDDYFAHKPAGSSNVSFRQASVNKKN